MKRIFIPTTLLVIAAMFLAACGSAAAPGSETQMPGLTPEISTDTPTAGMTSAAPTEAAPTTVAPTTVAPTTAAPTTAAPTASAATPAAGALPTQAATPLATEAVTGTPAASGGETVPNQFVRLSSLLSANVTASDNQQAGQVDGVLISHLQAPAAAQEGATPAAGATPTAAPQVAGTFDVRYVLVDTSTVSANNTNSSSSGKIVVVPWQALNTSAPVGDTVALNVSSDVLAQAPHMALMDIASGNGSWNNEVASYWSGQGIAGIPATGAEAGQSTDLALIPRSYRGITISSQEGKEIGAVADFIIDPASGEILYAVFNGGETFGNHTFAVPMTYLTWTGNNGTQLGSFQFNFSNETLQNAPFIQSLDGIQLGKDWSNQLNQFWSGIQKNNGK